MTEDQAFDLRDFLINELTVNGFADIVDEVNYRLSERFDIEERPFQNQNETLFFFLREAMYIFDGMSNKNFKAIIDRINANLEGGRIDGIEVEMLGKGQERQDLVNLPDYSQIVSLIQEIYEQIANDNNN